MRNALLILFILINFFECKSQAITSVTVLNGSFITTIDTVFLKVTGGFAELGGVTSKGYSVGGSLITATINGCTSGLQTVTNFNETIKINPLSQGAYKIKVKLIEYDNFVYPGCNVVKYSTGDSININVVTYTGIDENLKAINRIRFYPNPTKNKILIDGESFDLEDTKINIYNSLGQCVCSINNIKSKQEIDFADLPVGLYYLQIQKGTYQKTSKLIKE